MPPRGPRNCLALALLLLAMACAPAAAQPAACGFQGGFATIQAAIPATVGPCTEAASTNPATGNVIQHTPGGVFVFRKADHFTAFSDGTTTWLLDPQGNVVSRPARQAFDWEFNPDGWPLVGSGAVAADGPCPIQPLPVVAVENQWGSLLQQLGGQCVKATNVITDPSADPHDYQPTTADALSYQTAQLVVENGAGYDDFSDRLLATVTPRPLVINAASVVGAQAGDNPHLWYSPADVDQVSAAITGALEQLAPDGASYFDRQAQAFTSRTSTYKRMLQQIRQTFAGRPVGATESIFVPLAQATGLNLISPPGFMDAISEGNDPVAQDMATFQNQITQRQITLLVVNDQTTTNLTDQLTTMATSNGIPVVAISETMPPEYATFQGWQATQLLALSEALGGQQ